VFPANIPAALAIKLKLIALLAAMEHQPIFQH